MKIIEQILPHRPPILMVESIIDYVGGDVPILHAEYRIRESDPVFSGAAPRLSWPSAYIIEGLGQSCSLVSFLWTYERSGAAKKLGAENVSSALMNIGDPNTDDIFKRFLSLLEEGTMKAVPKIGMLASVDVEVTGQVRSGELLQYRVKQTRLFGALIHYTVQASVETRVIAQGTLVGAAFGGS